MALKLAIEAVRDNAPAEISFTLENEQLVLHVASEGRKRNTKITFSLPDFEAALRYLRDQGPPVLRQAEPTLEESLGGMDDVDLDLGGMGEIPEPQEDVTEDAAAILRSRRASRR